MLLDNFLPDYEFSEFHTITVNAPPERIFRALKELTGADLSPLIFLLLDIRALPARLLRRQSSGSCQPGPFLERLYKGGFIPLAEEPGREIVFGLVGQFWTLTGGIEPNVPNAAAFLVFADPALAKVAANLAVSVDNRGCTRCSTETRIHVPRARAVDAAQVRLLLADHFAGQRLYPGALVEGDQAQSGGVGV